MDVQPITQTPGDGAGSSAGNRFDQAVERSRDTLASGWEGEWQRRVEARDAAKAEGNEALAQHYQAELDAMRPVMEQLGLATDSAGQPPVSVPPGEQPPAQQKVVETPDTPITNPPVAGPGGEGLNLPPALEPFREAIQGAAEASGIPANVIAGMIWDESRGDISALTTNGGNGLGDTGLMQVNPNTFADLQGKYPELLGGKTLSDPATNIMAGALYLKEQMNSFGSLDLALRAYNSGPLNVNPNDAGDISKYGTGDAAYVDKVNSYAAIIGSGEGQLPA